MISGDLTRFAKAPVALLLTLLAAPLLHADGGALQLHRQAGPWLVSVFTAPPLPRAGPIDFSVLLQTPGSLTPVVDARVEVIANDGSGVTVSRAAFHEQAQNRLLYAALLTLPHEGAWRYEVAISHSSTQAVAAGSLRVFPAASRLDSHWRELWFAPLLLLLFALHQALSLSGKRRHSTPATTPSSLRH